jgi:hypothetical protein
VSLWEFIGDRWSRLLIESYQHASVVIQCTVIAAIIGVLIGVSVYRSRDLVDDPLRLRLGACAPERGEGMHRRVETGAQHQVPGDDQHPAQPVPPAPAPGRAAQVSPDGEHDEPPEGPRHAVDEFGLTVAPQRVDPERLGDAEGRQSDARGDQHVPAAMNRMLGVCRSGVPWEPSCPRPPNNRFHSFTCRPCPRAGGVAARALDYLDAINASMLTWAGWQRSPVVAEVCGRVRNRELAC